MPGGVAGGLPGCEDRPVIVADMPEQPVCMPLQHLQGIAAGRIRTGRRTRSRKYLLCRTGGEQAFILTIPVGITIAVQKQKNAELLCPVQHFSFQLPGLAGGDCKGFRRTVQDL